MDTNDSASCSETNMLRIQLLKKDEIEGTLRKELRDKAIALKVAEERIQRLVAASQKQKEAEDSVVAGSSSKDAGRNTQSKPNGGTTAPKPEPISPQRRMVPYVDLPPPSRKLSTSGPPPPRQNHESPTLDEMEVEDTPSMSPPPSMKLEPKSPHKHRRLIPYVRVPSPPHQNHDVEEMEVEDTPSMSPPPSMKLEPKSPHKHKRLIPYINVPLLPHQNHGVEEMELEDTPSMSPPPSMKLEPKSPHKHKRLIPYVSVPLPPQQNQDERSTVEEMEVEDTPSISPPPSVKLEPKSPRKHKRLIPYISVPSPPHQNHGVEEMEVEGTPSMSPPPNMKLEPKSPHRHKRLIPYVSVPSPPHQNHGVEEMEVEDTLSISPPPSMKLEPKSPRKHKRLIPYVSVPSRSSVRPANKRPANGDPAQRNPKLSTKRRKLASGPPVKDEVPHIEPFTPMTRRTPLIAAKVSDFSQHQLPTPTTSAKRPKKEENKVFSLPRSITDTYLKFYKPLTISPPPTPLKVPRKLLRLAYGGSDQQFLQFLQPTTNPSSPGTLRRMVWPQIEMNPLMPSVPGHPGIVFASRHEILENPPWTVWCRCLESAKAMWYYLGEYESELCGQMSAEQFRDQPQKAKEAWAELLIKGKAFDVYVAMRARIALRKHNVFPLEREVLEDGKPETDEQVNERAKSLEEEMKAIKRNKGRKVDSGDVIRAFSRGDEAIDIIRMRCVLYDHVFAQDLQRQFDNYDQLLEREREKKAAEGSSSKRKMKGVTRRAERGKGKGKGKALDVTASDEESEVESEDDLQYASRASSSSSRPKRKSTKWDANTGGRVVVGRGDMEENNGNVEVLGLESDDDELPELTDSNSGADGD